MVSLPNPKDPRATFKLYSTPSLPDGIAPALRGLLRENPGESEDSKRRLIEELREKAKAAFGAKDLDICDALYSRALEVGGGDAVLLANRALVRLRQARASEALEDAAEALRLDPSNTKAWHHKARAFVVLGNFQDAVTVCDEALGVEPGNSALMELRAHALTEWERDASAKAKFRTDAHDPSQQVLHANRTLEKEQLRERMAAGVAPALASDATGGQPPASAPPPVPTAEAEPSLPPPPPPQPRAVDTKSKEALSRWARERLAELVAGAHCELPGGVGRARVENVTEVEGEAELMASRRKIFYTYDLRFVAHWIAEPADGGEAARGVLRFTECSTDGGCQVEPEVHQAGGGTARTAVDRAVSTEDGTLQAAVRAKVDEWVAEYQSLEA